MLTTHRCTRCLASSKRVFVDHITHVCNDCMSPSEKTIKEVGDAMRVGVMYSGGKDSLYLIHYLHSILPDVEIVPIFVDNGMFLPEQLYSVSQLLRFVHKQDNLVVNQSYLEVFVDATRQNVLSTIANKSFGSSNIDHDDGESIHEVGILICQDMGIPVLATGVTAIQHDNIMPQAPVAEQHKHVKVIMPLVALGVGEQLIVSTLCDQLGIARESIAPLVTNSQLITLITYIDYKLHGYSSYEREICKQVRISSGDITRATWRHIFHETERAISNGTFDISFPLQQIGTTKQELDDMINVVVSR